MHNSEQLDEITGRVFMKAGESEEEYISLSAAILKDRGGRLKGIRRPKSLHMPIPMASIQLERSSPG